MKTTLHTLFLFLLVAVGAVAQPSSDYYAKADGKKSAELKASLHAIIGYHKRIAYSSLWNSYAQIDYLDETNGEGQKRVFDYYSDEKFYFNANGSSVSGMDKEHTVPQSWWSKQQDIDIYSDLFQVLPSEHTANQAKSNNPLGEVAGSVSFSNARIKVGTDASGSTVFEPCDEYKGDFARIYFYVATCYPYVPWVNNVNYAFVQEAYPTLKPEFLKLLLQWNQNDPVSDWEKTRQERVFAVQGNRNPFIDYPDLANYIWGCLTEEEFDLDVVQLYQITPYDYSDDETPQPQNGELLAENFSSITAGNSTSTTGSNSQWNGNDSFANVDKAYQAGGAVRLGTGSLVGSLTTKILEFDGGTLIVTVQVKGWTTVEGDLDISVVGTNLKQTVSYTAKMSDDWQTVQVTFENVPANPQICLATTNKRCFINDLTITTPMAQETEISFTMNQYGLATYCSTYDLDFTDVEGLKAYIATGYTHGNIILTRVGNVPAGTGLVIMGEPGTYTVPVGDGQAVFSNLLVGTTKDITLPATFGSKTNFILTQGTNGIGFYPVSDDGGTLKAGKAYLPLPTALMEAAGVKNFGLHFEDGDELPTDVEELDYAQLSTFNAQLSSGWYTLDGRRLQHRPAQPGIYLRGGRKVIVQ